MAQSQSEWRCINNSCSRVLGYVRGGEFYPAEDVVGDNIHTRGPNLTVTCPDCGTIKMWYTADPITRALYQLVEAISSVAAKRMVRKVSELTMTQNKK